MRHAWESRGDEQKKPGVDRSAPGGWAPNVPKSRYATAGANPPPKGASSSKSKSSKGWDSDEDLFTKAKVHTRSICRCAVLWDRATA